MLEANNQWVQMLEFSTPDTYDDSPWTREELDALAWERVQHEDWDEYESPEPL